MILAEGILAVAPPEGPARAWFAPDPKTEVATVRLSKRGEITPDGPVEELQAEVMDVVFAELDAHGLVLTRRFLSQAQHGQRVGGK